MIRFRRWFRLAGATAALSLLVAVSLSAPAAAHLPGQPSFLRINGSFVDYYPVKQPKTGFIGIPQSTDINRHMPGEALEFGIDRKLLAVSNNDANDMTFQWDFGDGGTATGLTAKHTYQEAGAYMLRIHGTVEGKRRLIESSAIFILPSEDFQRPRVFVSVDGREVSNDTEAISMPAGQQVRLSARLAPDTARAGEFRWDFGDGATATGQTVTHTFKEDYRNAYATVHVNVDDGRYFADNSAQLVNPDGGVSGGPAEWYASAKRAMEQGLSQVFGNDRTNYGLALLILLFAVIAGAFHSLTPGHGKTVLAALLIGQKDNRYKDLAILTAAITIAHTLVIYIVGFTLLGLNASRSVNSLLPYFEKASAILVFVLAVYLLSTGIRKLIAERRHQPGHDHSHGDAHTHEHDQHNHHSHDAEGGHGHHHHAMPAFVAKLGKNSHTWSLVIAGTGGGIVPCIDALSLMLLAAGLGHPGFGLILVLFFSLGLALTIAALGLLLLAGKRKFLPSDRYEKQVSIAAPIISGSFILVIALILLV